MVDDWDDRFERPADFELDPEVLYTFSRFEYLDLLKMGQLWFAPSKTYNDIHEDTVFARPADILSPGDPYSAALTGEGSIRRWLRSQVIRCFTPDPTNTLMWSHYAESHKGVCVGFSLEKL